ncbi:MAG: TIGR03088 family PEP-CTERM/XrtA system glycosyltransferase [Proteobacteria bacterium]|nr:TIGR03088 family PEP-CTERM/XrtA system glycosyltransferase [Pseudomonadota bacterium]
MPDIQGAVDRRPLIAHVLFRLDYGGLENGVVNLINSLPPQSWRHAVIALTEATAFRERIRPADVGVYELHKRPGNDPRALLRLYRLLRTLRPALVHTRNLPAIEAALIARLAGVPRRIHGEHGWDVYDPQGMSVRYRALRRAISPAINRFVAVSGEIEQWLTSRVGIGPSRVTRICNGVDTDRFHPRATARATGAIPGAAPGEVVVGSVTRFSAIKDPLNLVRAFVLARRDPRGQALRLVMLGDGALRSEALQLLRQAGQTQQAWLPGSRDDVAQILPGLDIFALTSIREGISNTVLEAMASGLPVVASATGGNLELVQDGITGRLVACADPQALAEVLLQYAADPQLRAAHGAAARRRAVEQYSLRRMIADYAGMYARECAAIEEAA